MHESMHLSDKCIHVHAEKVHTLECSNGKRKNKPEEPGSTGVKCGQGTPGRRMWPIHSSPHVSGGSWISVACDPPS